MMKEEKYSSACGMMGPTTIITRNVDLSFNLFNDQFYGEYFISDNVARFTFFIRESFA